MGAHRRTWLPLAALWLAAGAALAADGAAEARIPPPCPYRGEGFDWLHLQPTRGDLEAFAQDLGAAVRGCPPGVRPPVFAGFEDDRYQQHDHLIGHLVLAFNQHHQEWCGCSGQQAGGILRMEPGLVKSWLIQESGGRDRRSLDAWAVDPAQVNVPGDWAEVKTELGLRPPARRSQGDRVRNLAAALRFLCRKGFGRSGQAPAKRPDGAFDGWRTAFERYNGRNDETENGKRYSVNYAERIVGRAASPDRSFPIPLPAPRR